MIRSIPMVALPLAAAISWSATAADARKAAPTRAIATAGAVDAVARRYHLAGEALVARGGRILLDRGYGTVAPAGGRPHRAGEHWRLASITKQVTAAMILSRLPVEVLNASRHDGVTLRQMLTHHTGYPNPDTTPLVGGVPHFYAGTAPDYQYCAAKPGVPGAPFSYNNCDYILADLFSHWDAPGPNDSGATWPAGMTMARPGEIGIPGYVGGKPEPRFQLPSYGAAGGLMGTARAIFDFDRSLMTGKLLSPAALAELWKPEGNGSYQALGQWVFPGQLKGCAGPKRIVQRDGEIYGVQARNFIFPDDDLVVIVFTNRSADDFALGEVWQGKGFVYDLLSAAAC